jgi:hypothetical protein
MTEKKYPDLVVWDSTKGFYARELTYGSNLGAPSIQIDDVGGWKQSKVNGVNSQFKAEYDELLNRAEELKEQFIWNHFVYTKVNYTFLPVVGHVYHIYEKADGNFFMSIVEPNSWNQKFVGSTKLESTNKWIKI